MFSATFYMYLYVKEYEYDHTKILFVYKIC